MVTTAFVILLLCFAINRLITSRAVSGLSVEQKVALVDASVAKRPWFYVALAALLVVYALVSANFGHRDWLFIVFIIAILALSIPMLMLRLRRLSALGMSARFMRSAYLSSAVLWLGLLVLFGAMVYNVITFVPSK